MHQNSSPVTPHNSTQETFYKLQAAGTLPSSTKNGQLCLHKVPPWHRGERRSLGAKATVAQCTSLCLRPEEQRGPLHWLKPKTKVPPTESTAFLSSQEGF